MPDVLADGARLGALPPGCKPSGSPGTPGAGGNAFPTSVQVRPPEVTVLELDFRMAAQAGTQGEPERQWPSAETDARDGGHTFPLPPSLRHCRTVRADPIAGDNGVDFAFRASVPAGAGGCSGVGAEALKASYPTGNAAGRN